MLLWLLQARMKAAELAPQIEIYDGIIIIRYHAKVTAYAENCGAAIGSEDEWDMTGKIIIVGNAIVNTGVVDDAGNVLSNRIGYIGGGENSNHDSSKGHYILGSDVTNQQPERK